MSSVQWSWQSSNGIRISILNLIVSHNKEFYPKGTETNNYRHNFRVSLPSFSKKELIHSNVHFLDLMNKHRHIPSSFDNTKTTWNNFEVEVEIAASWLVAAWCFEAGASIAVKQSVTKHKLLRSTMDLNLMLSPCYLGAKNIRTLIFNLMIKQSPLGKCCFVRLIPYWWEFPTCDCSEKSVKKLKMLSSIWPRTRHLQKRVSPTDTCPLDTNSNGNEQFSSLEKSSQRLLKRKSNQLV